MRRPSPRLGEMIRRQRELHRLTLRQFAAMTGISNPYLSQIERGLRTPSAEVVDALARSLNTSADDLYDEADSDSDEGRARVQAVLDGDPALSPRQRRLLIDIYDALVAAGPTHGSARSRDRSDHGSAG
jgi:transcriptional regulator with XRE-family HTH domain